MSGYVKKKCRVKISAEVLHIFGFGPAPLEVSQSRTHLLRAPCGQTGPLEPYWNCHGFLGALHEILTNICTASSLSVNSWWLKSEPRFSQQLDLEDPSHKKHRWSHFEVGPAHIWICMFVCVCVSMCACGCMMWLYAYLKWHICV